MAFPSLEVKTKASGSTASGFIDSSNVFVLSEIASRRVRLFLLP
jgi:hypothetical protein